MKIKGKITDEKTGESLIGASIYLSDASGNLTADNIGVAASVDGKFETPEIPDSGYLTASFVGYNKKTANYNKSNSTIYFQLESKQATLPEATVTATPLTPASEGKKKGGILPFILIGVGAILTGLGIKMQFFPKK